MVETICAYIERKKNATMQSRLHVLAPSGISSPKKKKKIHTQKKASGVSRQVVGEVNFR